MLHFVNNKIEYCVRVGCVRPLHIVFVYNIQLHGIRSGRGSGEHENVFSVDVLRPECALVNVRAEVVQIADRLARGVRLGVAVPAHDERIHIGVIDRNVGHAEIEARVGELRRRLAAAYSGICVGEQRVQAHDIINHYRVHSRVVVDFERIRGYRLVFEAVGVDRFGLVERKLVDLEGESYRLFVRILPARVCKIRERVDNFIRRRVLRRELVVRNGRNSRVGNRRIRSRSLGNRFKEHDRVAVGGDHGRVVQIVVVEIAYFDCMRIGIARRVKFVSEGFGKSGNYSGTVVLDIGCFVLKLFDNERNGYVVGSSVRPDCVPGEREFDRVCARVRRAVDKKSVVDIIQNVVRRGKGHTRKVARDIVLVVERHRGGDFDLIHPSVFVVIVPVAADFYILLLVVVGNRLGKTDNSLLPRIVFNEDIGLSNRIRVNDKTEIQIVDARIVRPLHIVGVFKAEYYGIRVGKRNLRADRKRAVSVVNSLHRVGGCKTPVDVFVLDTRQNKLVCPDVARVRHRLRELIHQYRGRLNFGYLNFHFLHGYEEFLVDRVVRARGIPSFVCRVDVELNAVRDGHGGIVAARRAVRGHRHRVRTVRVRRVAYLELRVSARRRVAYLDVDILVFRRRNLVAEEAVDNVEAYVVAVKRVVRKAAVVFELLVSIILEYGNLNKLFGNRELERTVFRTAVVVPEIVFGIVRVGNKLYRYGIGIDVCRRELEVSVVARV